MVFLCQTLPVLPWMPETELKEVRFCKPTLATDREALAYLRCQIPFMTPSHSFPIPMPETEKLESLRDDLPPGPRLYPLETFVRETPFTAMAAGVLVGMVLGVALLPRRRR